MNVELSSSGLQRNTSTYNGSSLDNELSKTDKPFGKFSAKDTKSKVSRSNVVPLLEKSSSHQVQSIDIEDSKTKLRSSVRANPEWSMTRHRNISKGRVSKFY